MPPTQKQLDNLIPQNKRTKIEQREIAVKGGKASAEARRRKKNLAELAKTFSELQVVDDKAKKALAKLGISEDDATQGMVMVASMFNAASKGKVAAAKLIGEWMEAGAVLQENSETDPLSAAFEALEGETDEN